MSQVTPSVEAQPLDASSRRKAILGGIFGNLIEFHDFAIYGLLAGTISRIFFPGGDPVVALLAAMLVYTASFVARPLGGVVLGRLGDRLGRMRLLALTVLGMSVASAVMAFLPTYAQIGVWAPILLVLCRCAQGFFAGGEFAGATSYIVEQGLPRNRARNAALSPAAAYMGTSLGLIIFTVVSASMSQAAFDAWGWRVLFAVAIPLGFVGVIIRLRLDESPTFVAIREHQRANAIEPPSLKAVVRTQWKPMLFFLGILASHTLPNYLAIGFFATYLIQFVGQTQTEASLAVAISQITLIFTTLAAGALNDRLGRRRTLITGCLVLVPLIFVAFGVAQFNTLPTSIIAGMVLVCAYPLISSAMAVGLVELFPADMRVSAGSITYNVGTAALGGTAPLIATALIAGTGSGFSVALYVSAVAIVTLVLAITLFNRFQCHD